MSTVAATVGRARRFESPPFFRLATVLLTVFCAVLAGIAIGWLRGAPMPVWIGTAVAMYWLWRSPNSAWPSIAAMCWLANVAAEVVLGRTAPRLFVIPTINLIEALVLAAPLRLFKLDGDFTQPRALAVFYALVLGPGTMVTALIGAFTVNRLMGEALFPSWSDWYVPTALGQAMLVPPMMVLRWEDVRAIFAREKLAGTALLLGILAAAVAINLIFHAYPLGFLFFPAVVLITFQRGFAGGVLALVLVIVCMGLGLRDIHSVIPGPDGNLHIVFLQLYAAVISFTVIVVGAGLEQRQKLETSLAAAREEALTALDVAEAANRAKTMFLANMSHELRTPLNAVIGFSDLMHRESYGPLGNTRYRDYTKSIHDAGTHLLEVIGDILDMSKIEVGKYEIAREELELDVLACECGELMRERAAARHIGLEMDLAAVRIAADRRAMKQILLNLLSNAIKFTPAGGKVSLGTRSVDGDLVLTVTDTGIGIAADDLHTLGQPFVQLRRMSAAVAGQAGTGLGLALTRALVEMHGGSLRIESEEGLGTRVTVELPHALSGASHAIPKTATA